MERKHQRRWLSRRPLNERFRLPSRSITRSDPTSTALYMTAAHRLIAARAAGRCRCSCPRWPAVLRRNVFPAARPRGGTPASTTCSPPSLQGLARQAGAGSRRDAGRLTGRRQASSVDRSSTLGRVALSRDLSANGVRDLAEQYDPEFGGFGFSPRAAEPAQVPRAGQPRLPARPGPADGIIEGLFGADVRDPQDARPDGPRRNPRPPGRRLSSL